MDANEMRESVERLEQDVIMDIQDTIGTPIAGSFIALGLWLSAFRTAF